MTSTSEFIFSYWDNECAVYDELSGNSHLLTADSAEILGLMQKKVPESQLLDKVLSLNDITDEQSIEMIKQLRIAFNESGLLNQG